jgi:hypothetical protein
MITRVEILDKIDAVLRIDPQNSDESIAYPIIRELRDHHQDFLEKLITLESEKSEIGIEDLLFIKSLAEQAYSEKATNEILIIDIIIREQLRKIMNLPPLTAIARS